MTSQGGPSAVGQTAAGDAVTTTPDGVPAPAGDRVASAVKDTGSVIGHTAIDTADRATTTGREAPVTRRPSHDLGPIWALLLPPLAALAFCLSDISTPSYWRDEAATMAAVKRPLGDLITMLGNVDAVHGAYYLMMWPIAHVFGTGELVMRLPSALAVAVTATFVAAIGRRMASPWVGLAAGLLFAIIPAESRFGQEARSYAMVMAVATIASYLLIRVFSAEPARRRRWLIGYGASLAALGLINIFGLLLVPSHAVAVALQLRRRSTRKDVRRLAVGWLVAAVAGIAICTPVLVLGWQQRGQIAWLANALAATWPGDVGDLALLTGSTLVTVVIGAVIVIAFILSSDATSSHRAAWRWPLAELSLPWMLVPPTLLVVASAFSPIYTSRYVLMCLPAAALLGGMGVVSLGRVAGPVALALVMLAGLNNQIDVRQPSGHGDNVRGLDQIIAADVRPGDVVLYANPNANSFSAAYSYGLGTLRDIAINQGPIRSGTLAGTSVDLATVRTRLRHAKRVWLIEINTCVSIPKMLSLSAAPEGLVIRGLPLRYLETWRRRNDWMMLYEHGHGSQGQRTACVRPH